MTKRPRSTATPASDLSTRERVLLFCVATITAMIVRGLVQRDPIGRLILTKQGRDALDALLARD